MKLNNYFHRIICSVFCSLIILFTSCEGRTQPEDDTNRISIVSSQRVMNIDSDEGNYAVKITATCSWTARVFADWITLDVQKGTAGESELKFRVEENRNPGERPATILVSSDVEYTECQIDVIQAPFEPKINFSQSSLTAESCGGTYLVSVDANTTYSATTDVKWISIETTSDGLKLDIDKSDSLEERTAEIVFRSIEYDAEDKTMTVKQRGWEITAENTIYYTGRLNYKASGEFCPPEIPGVEVVCHICNDESGALVCDGPITVLGGFRHTQLLTSITIPECVTAIDDHAFDNCLTLKKIVLPDGLVSIGESAFKDCGLEEIIIPDSVTELGDYAFLGCARASKVVIGNGITDEDVELTGVFTRVSPQILVVGDGIVNVSAFVQVNSLYSLTIGANARKIEGFASSKYLTSIYCKSIHVPEIKYSKLSASTFPFNDGMKIYVPRESYDFYVMGCCDRWMGDAFVDQYNTANWQKYSKYLVAYDFEE